MRWLIVSRLIWIYAVYKSLLLSPVAVKQLRWSNSVVLRENRNPLPSTNTHTNPRPTTQWIVSFSIAVTSKIRSRSPECNYYVQIIYPGKFGKNPATGSKDIVQTRKWNSDTDANGIRTKNNTSSPLWWGVGGGGIINHFFYFPPISILFCSLPTGSLSYFGKM